MKIKDIITICVNSNNKQIAWNPKKKKIKKMGITVDDITNMDLAILLKRK